MSEAWRTRRFALSQTGSPHGRLMTVAERSKAPAVISGLSIPLQAKDCRPEPNPGSVDRKGSKARSWRLFPTERPTVLRILGAFTQTDGLQRFSPFDIVRERTAHLRDKSPPILRIPEGL